MEKIVEIELWGSLLRDLDNIAIRYGVYSLEMNHGWININTPQDLKEAKQTWGEPK